MLKTMRKHAKFFYVLFFIVILSFIFWGVGTVDKSTAVPVAEIEKDKITIEEYWTVYDRTRDFYRNISGGTFTEEMEKKLNLKQKVLDSLIDERVLLIEAKKAGLGVTDAELEEAIVNDPKFMRDGVFSKEVYIRTLQLNRLTPEFFEPMKRKELLFNKMQRLVGGSVETTDLDIAGSVPDEVRQTLLAQKRDKAMKSYIEGLKKQMKIKVNQQLIS